MTSFYFVCFLLLASTSALPQGKDDYQTEIDIHQYQRPYEDAVSSDEMEAQVVMSMLPIQVTRDYIRLDKYQAMAAIKLAKAIMKPIIKSKEFRYSVKAFEQLLHSLKEDPEVRRNMKEAVDAMQEIYYRTDNQIVKELLTWLLAQYTDETTARSVSSMWSDLSPVINQWVIDPVLSYYKAWLTPTIATFKNGLDGFFGEDISSNVIGRSSRWSDYVQAYIERVADMTSGAREMLEATAKFLEMQDDAELPQ